jgi:hypothetical protein
MAIALAGPVHGPHAIDHSRLDLDEALAPIALHGPTCCALGQRRGDGVIGRISKGDANHVRALDPASGNFMARTQSKSGEVGSLTVVALAPRVALEPRMNLAPVDVEHAHGDGAGRPI